MSLAKSFACILIFSACAPLAHAESTPQAAGFAPTSIWISKTALTAGDTATLFTVLYNSSASAIAGDVVFTVDDVSVGSKHAELSAGASQIVSINWTAVTGTHTISARFDHPVDTGTKAAASIKDASAGSISVTVAAPAPPPPVVAAATEALPVITKVADAAYKTAESVRTAGAAALTNALASSKGSGSVAEGGEVLGASTSRLPAAAAAAGAGSFFANVWHGFLSALLYIFQSQLLFYLLVLFVLFMLYKLIAVMFRDRKNRR